MVKDLNAEKEPYANKERPLQHYIKLLFEHEEWLAKLDHLSIHSKQTVRGMMAGKRRASQLGASLEFADYRPYIEGDDTRKIDWNLYGRIQKPYIRQYWDEQERNINIVVDHSLSMLDIGDGEHNKALFALRLAATLGYITLQGDDRLQMLLLTEQGKVKQLPSLYGKAAKFKWIEQLGIYWNTTQTEHAAKVKEAAAGMSTDEATNLHALINHLNLLRRPGVTWFITDGLYEEGLNELLTQLQARGQEVVVVHVLHQEELSPQLEGELKLIDVENKLATEVAISNNVLERYQLTVQLFQQQLKHACESRGMRYLFMNSSLPLQKQWLAQLSDHSFMRFN